MSNDAKCTPDTYVCKLGKNIKNCTKEEIEELQGALDTIINAKLEGWENVKTLDDVEIMKIESALTNKIYRCKCLVNDKVKNPVLLRLYGDGCDELFDRNEEIEIFKTLDKNDFGVHFLASIPNGRIEEWSEYYDPISNESLFTPDSRRRIAIKLAQMHKTKMPNEDKNSVYTRCRNWIESIKKHCTGEKFADLIIENFEKELADLEELYKKEEEYEKEHNIHYDYVCGHTDIHRGNILQNIFTKDIMIVDFEYSIYTTAPFDISFLFFDWMLDYSKPDSHNLLEDVYPSIEEQRFFLTHYLEAYYGTKPSEEYIDQYIELIQKHTCLCIFMWVLWGFLESAISAIPYDYYAYSVDRSRYYYAQKEKVFHKSSLKFTKSD